MRCTIGSKAGTRTSRCRVPVRGRTQCAITSASANISLSRYCRQHCILPLLTLCLLPTSIRRERTSTQPAKAHIGALHPPALSFLRPRSQRRSRLGTQPSGIHTLMRKCRLFNSAFRQPDPSLQPSTRSIAADWRPVTSCPTY